MAKKKTKKGVKKKVKMSVLEKQQNKQLIVFFTIILLCLGGLIGGYLYVKRQNAFSYAEVDFVKGKEGDVTFYHGRFPINYRGQTLKVFNLYLRMSPKENKVPIETNFSLSREVIVSFEPGLEKCPLAIIGHSTLSQFVSVFPWVENVTGAVNDKTYAEENGIGFADCSKATTGKTVILARSADKSSIEKEGENCFVLNVANCEYLAVSERYIMGVIAQINEVEL